MNPDVKEPRAVVLHSEVHTDWSGEPIRVLEEARGMTERGYRVIIAAPRRSELIKRASAAGLPVEPVFMKKWVSYPWSLQKAVGILIRNKVDIVNTHASYDSWIFSIAARILNRKLIRTRHMSFLGKGLGSAFIYRLPDCIITTSGESGLKAIRDRFGLKRGRIVVSIPSGPNVEQFDPDRVSRPAQDFGVGPGDKVAGMVAAFRRGKGHADLITAIPRILEKFGNVRFLFVGGGNPQSRERLAGLASSLGVADKCVFTGHRHDIPQRHGRRRVPGYPARRPRPAGQPARPCGCGFAPAGATAALQRNGGEEPHPRNREVLQRCHAGQDRGVI
ncbi:MAG: glycosyltransferase family 4 protein [Candidatus Sulfobium sp.]